jgi:hypothetical protein
MLVLLELGSDFSRWCADREIGHLLFATHLTRRSGEDARQCPQRRSEPFCRGDSERLGLDSACGPGNFLNVSMQRLLNSEREGITFAVEVGLPTFYPKVGPEQVSRGRRRGPS